MRVLKDKHVTQAEFDESMQVYTECLTAAGLRYDVQAGGSGMGAVIVSGSGAPSTGSGNAMDECIHQVDAVQEVWILQNQVSAADIDKLQAKYISCLRDAGLPIKEGTTFADAQRAATEFMDSLPEKFDDNSPQGTTVNKASECQYSYQTIAGAQPLPGLREALNHLDTSGW